MLSGAPISAYFQELISPGNEECNQKENILRGTCSDHRKVFLKFESE